MLTINQRLALERVIVKHLIETMAAHGWTVNHVWDGGDEVRSTDIGAQLDAVFSVDESQIIFENTAGRQHWVSIILGNDGWDCIADYSYALHGADDFNKVMTDFVDPFIDTLQEAA